MYREFDLIRHACKGDIDAFRRLFEENNRRIFFLALDLTGNIHDAEDLTQEVFISAFSSLEKFRGESRFSSWLYRITINLWINRRRKKSLEIFNRKINSSELERMQKTDNSSLDPERCAESALVELNIKKALERLSAKERSIFVLKHYHDLKLKEISEILGISLGTVKSTLFRAMRRLRKELDFYRSEFDVEV